jgi:hypothetical protein
MIAVEGAVMVIFFALNGGLAVPIRANRQIRWNWQCHLEKSPEEVAAWRQSANYSTSDLNTASAASL